MASPKPRVSDWSADDLERAAKYMRELDASKNAKVAIELARREQDVEIESHKAKQREQERARQQQVNEYERIKHEESRKTLQAKLESDKVRPSLCFPRPRRAPEAPRNNTPRTFLHPARAGPHGLQAEWRSPNRTARGPPRAQARR
jgi:hypothetical protein